MTKTATANVSAHTRSHARNNSKGKGPSRRPNLPTSTSSSELSGPSSHRSPPGNPPSNPPSESPDPPGGPPDGDPPDNPPDGPGGDDIGQPPDGDLTAVQAINLLVDALKSGKTSKTKVREPDVFDGATPKKLRTFLAQCALNYGARPESFTTDKSKINYAISYLSGLALTTFEPHIIDPPPPTELHFMNNYVLFVEVLQSNFGPFDQQSDAKLAIDKLFMKDNQRITKYIVEFDRIAPLTEWDDKALRNRFYRNLPTRLKDEISSDGKPKTLAGMRTLAQLFDHRYWERQEEIRQENAQRKSGSSNSGKNNNGNSSHNSDKTHDKNKSSKQSSNSSSANNSASKNRNSGSNSNQSGSSKPTPPPEYVNKLGKDGKLTPEERERRRANKLCLFCGLPGHTVENCPKSTSNASKTKGRASALAPNSDAPSSSGN